MREPSLQRLGVEMDLAGLKNTKDMLSDWNDSRSMTEDVVKDKSKVHVKDL